MRKPKASRELRAQAARMQRVAIDELLCRSAEVIDQLFLALVRARVKLQDERDGLVECATIPPQHDLATLDPFTRRAVEELDELLAELLAALVKAGGEQ